MLKSVVEWDLQVWHGYVQRKSAKIFRAEEMITLGMVSEIIHEFC